MWSHQTSWKPHWNSIWINASQILPSDSLRLALTLYHVSGHLRRPNLARWKLWEHFKWAPILNLKNPENLFLRSAPLYLDECGAWSSSTCHVTWLSRKARHTGNQQMWAMWLILIMNFPLTKKENIWQTSKEGKYDIKVTNYRLAIGSMTNKRVNNKEK